MSTNIDWQTRPWGRPVFTMYNRNHDLMIYGGLVLVATFGFRYHGMKVNGWHLYRDVYGNRVVAPPADRSSDFQNPEERALFTSDVLALADAMGLFDFRDSAALAK